MFTGLVSDVGRVCAVEERGEGLRRIRIESAYDAAGIALGASIACSGPCLTVVAFGALSGGGAWFDVDAAAETLAKTTVGRWQFGTRINLERSLKIGDELGGHLVTGHVDGVASIVGREDLQASGADSMVRFEIRSPRHLAGFIAQKGSICLDGTSLTVNDVHDDTFSVLLIPHTLAVTTWRDRGAGDDLNIEVDLIARYAARLAQVRLDTTKT